MQERNDLVYTVNQEKPFTGVVVKNYENGQKELEQRYKNGLKHGTWTEGIRMGKKEKRLCTKTGIGKVSRLSGLAMGKVQ